MTTPMVSVGHEADFVDVTADTQVNLRLPLEVDIQLRDGVPAYSGAVDPVDLGQDEQRRFEPPNRTKPKWPGYRLSLPLDMEPRRQLPGATAQVAGSGTGRRKQGTAHPTYPGLAQHRQRAGIKIPTRFSLGNAPGLRSLDGQLPPVGAQFEPDPFGADLPITIDPDYRTRWPAGNDVSDPIRSPGAVLIDTVARLQLNPCVIRHGVNRFRRGSLLQLLSHLEDDALTVAILVPETRRSSRVGLVGALTAHYWRTGGLLPRTNQIFSECFRGSACGHNGDWERPT